ncbi:MAG TPA: methyltransferase [Thermoplasmata archaeon]|nr:methyltransferase [Thermoplasmata archaeon]
MAYEPWQVWGRKPQVEGTLESRAAGSLGEMESTKQLVKLVSEVWKPGMRVLDVGCNVGHYLRGIRRISSGLDYLGVDAYQHYIDKARLIFASDKHAAFQLKDALRPLFHDDPFDIVFCCNVLLHLPYFRVPLKNLVDSTRRFCFVRLLLGERTTIVKRVDDGATVDDDGSPSGFTYQNTYREVDVLRYLREDLGCQVAVVEDEFDPRVLDSEFSGLKKGAGTRIVDGKQADGNILFGWKFLKISK